MKIDMQEDYIQEIAYGEDYEAMLKCLSNGIKELKQVKDLYFAGKLKDKEAREMADAIEEKYKPVKDSLDKANNEGELNYSQHKKQMKLFGEMLKLYNDIFNHVVGDIIDALR